jgi:hypothetical protein
MASYEYDSLCAQSASGSGEERLGGQLGSLVARTPAKPEPYPRGSSHPSRLDQSCYGQSGTIGLGMPRSERIEATAEVAMSYNLASNMQNFRACHAPPGDWAGIPLCRRVADLRSGSGKCRSPAPISPGKCRSFHRSGVPKPASVRAAPDAAVARSALYCGYEIQGRSGT